MRVFNAKMVNWAYREIRRPPVLVNVVSSFLVRQRNATAVILCNGSKKVEGSAG